jgi:hypothetical protein
LSPFELGTCKLIQKLWLTWSDKPDVRDVLPVDLPRAEGSAPDYRLRIQLLRVLETLHSIGLRAVDDAEILIATLDQSRQFNLSGAFFAGDKT